MNKTALEVIEQSLPSVLRRHPKQIFPEDLVIVKTDGSVVDPTGELTNVEILSELEDTSDEGGLIDNEAHQDFTVDDPEKIYGEILKRSIDETSVEELNGILTSLREAFGGDFPGAPASSPSGYAPPPEVYAFYLPWHFFDVNTWGIYLIYEGIQAFARQLHAVTKPYLSWSECKRVATQFLFHHEAYHNAVETFGLRLEASHRIPCYVTGFQGPWKNWFNQKTLHEEGLATAYAANFTKTDAFTSYLPGQRRTFKRRCAFAAISNIIHSMPPEYATADILLTDTVSFEKAQRLFQEENLTSCFPKTNPVAADLWTASPHAMRPSLSRNDSFSYVISRSHPAVRVAAKVPHFNRQQVIKQLINVTHGKEVPQGKGKHPKFVANGKQVSVPNHPGDFPHGTLREILRQLDINMSVRQFMQAP